MTPSTASDKPNPSSAGANDAAPAPPVAAADTTATATERRILGIPLTYMEAIGVLVAALVAAGTIVDYVQRREENRAAQTLALVQLWEEKGYKSSFDAIEAAIAARIDGMSEAVRATLAKASEAERAKARTQIAANLMSRPLGERPGSAHVDSVVYFFTRVAICVDAGLCSRAASEAYFHDMTRSFWSYFGEHILEKRQAAYPTYGVELQRFARK